MTLCQRGRKKVAVRVAVTERRSARGDQKNVGASSINAVWSKNLQGGNDRKTLCQRGRKKVAVREAVTERRSARGVGKKLLSGWL